MFVIDGHNANLVLVAGRDGQGREPLRRRGRRRRDDRDAAWRPWTRRASRPGSSSPPRPARLVGEEGGAAPVLSRTLDLAAVALAAEQVGGAQRCLDMAVEYAKTRIQFGRPIGSFQAIKHKCADMLLEVESAKSAAYYAGWAAAEDSEELPVVASLAKSVLLGGVLPRRRREHPDPRRASASPGSTTPTSTSSGPSPPSSCSGTPATTASSWPSASASEPAGARAGAGLVGVATCLGESWRPLLGDTATEVPASRCARVPGSRLCRRPPTRLRRVEWPSRLGCRPRPLRRLLERHFAEGR